MLRGLALLLLFQSAGEALAYLGRLPIPGPVIGLVLLLAVLVWRQSRQQAPWSSLEQVADGLLAHLSIFFVPAAVGVMLYGQALAREGLAWVLAIMLSTAAALAVTAWWLAQRLPPEPADTGPANPADGTAATTGSREGGHV